MLENADDEVVDDCLDEAEYACNGNIDTLEHLMFVACLAV